MPHGLDGHGGAAVAHDGHGARVEGEHVGEGLEGVEEHQGLGRGVAEIEAVPDALLGQQALHEIEVALAVLHAVLAHGVLAGEVHAHGAAEGGEALVEHLLHGVGDLHLLEDPGVHPLREGEQRRGEVHPAQQVARGGAVVLHAPGDAHHVARLRVAGELQQGALAEQRAGVGGEVLVGEVEHDVEGL